MKFLIDLISEQLSGAFEKAGFDAAYGRATLSNRPDLCEYQCNGALAAAKKYHKAPIQIANAVLEALGENEMFASAEAVMPGFLNLKISDEYLAAYLRGMDADAHYGVQNDPDACTIVLDYGGPNVAKPLHVGHLRSAIIGESLKRIYRFFGNRCSHSVSHRFGFSGDFFCNGRIRCSDNLRLFLDRGRNDFRMRGFNLCGFNNGGLRLSYDNLWLHGFNWRRGIHNVFHGSCSNLRLYGDRCGLLLEHFLFALFFNLLILRTCDRVADPNFTGR